MALSSDEEDDLYDDEAYNPNDTMAEPVRRETAGRAAVLPHISSLWDCDYVEKGLHPKTDKKAWQCHWCDRWFPGGWNVTKALIHVSRTRRQGKGPDIILCAGDIDAPHMARYRGLMEKSVNNMLRNAANYSDIEQSITSSQAASAVVIGERINRHKRKPVHSPL